MFISDPDPAKSFGSLRIRIRIRNTVWSTGWLCSTVVQGRKIALLECKIQIIIFSWSFFFALCYLVICYMVQGQKMLCVGIYILENWKQKLFENFFLACSLVICEEMKKFNSNPEENNPDKIATLRYRNETATQFLQYEFSNEDLKSFSWCVFYTSFCKCLTV